MKTRRSTLNATKASIARSHSTNFKSSASKQKFSKSQKSTSGLTKTQKKAKRTLTVIDSGTELASQLSLSTVKPKQSRNLLTYSPIKTRAVTKRSKLKSCCRICKNDDNAFMTCSVCGKKYHLKCLGYKEESLRLISQKRCSSWLCPVCIFCNKCKEPINDPESVQCFSCDIAFHGKCKPRSGKLTNLMNPLSKWFCQACKPPSDGCKGYSKTRRLRKNNEIKETVTYEKNINSGPDILFESRKRVLRNTANTDSERNVNTQDGIKVCIPDVLGNLGVPLKAERRKRRIKRTDHLSVQRLEDEKMTVDKAVERQWIQFGSSRVLASYRSAYPEHLTKMNTLYLCEFCLMGFADEVSYTIHKNLCSWYNPPGNEIYRDGVLSFWEVDGNKDIGYCRRVCLLSKLFLAAKFIHYDVEPFIFYILTEHSRSGYVFVGYFSKEKDPDTANNLSCLFTFPTSRQLGYGKLLIDLSYKLSVREKKVGGPEHPLSDLGLITYQSYWKAVIISYFRKKKPVNTVCIKDISCETGLQTSDIIYTMLQNKMIRYVNGCHLFSMKNVYLAPLHALRRRVIHEEKLLWQPVRNS